MKKMYSSTWIVAPPNVKLNPTAYRVLRLHSAAARPANSYPMYGGGLT